MKDVRILYSSINWTIFESSAPRSRQIIMPASQHSIFLQAGWSSWRPTNSVKALEAMMEQVMMQLPWQRSVVEDRTRRDLPTQPP